MAVDVKPRDRVEKSGLQEDHRLIREQIGARFADLYVIRTEDHMHPDDVADAQLVLRARRLQNAQADAALSSLLPALHGWCRLGTVVDASGLAGAAFNAAVRLIDEGVLEVRENSRISYECYVRRRPA